MLSNLERAATWSAKAAQRLDADEEHALYEAYREVSLLVRALLYGEVTSEQAGVTLAEAKALEAARKTAWRNACEGV